MSDKILLNFDAKWYQATYSDVTQTGMKPEDHFLQFGRVMGRAGNPADYQKPKPKDVRDISSQLTELSRFGQDAAAQPKVAQVLPVQPGPIISRPDEIDAQPGKSIQAQGKPANVRGHSLLFGEIEIGRFQDEDSLRHHNAPVAAYCTMMGIAAPRCPNSDVDIQTLLSDCLTSEAPCGGMMFRGAGARIENAWFPGGSVLRVVCEKAAEAGYTVRAFQADLATPDQLQPVGAGLSLSKEGLSIFDIHIVTSFAPILLELSDADGFTRDLALIPFPSLLRGGLHATEMRALQALRNPMDSFWDLSDALLREFLGAGGQPARSIGVVDVDIDGATGAENIFSPEIQDWLAAVFGLRVRPLDKTTQPDGLGANWLHDSLEQGLGMTPALLTKRVGSPETGCLALQIPGEAVPTLAALVSRRLALPEGQSQSCGPFLVAEAVSMKPRWSVYIPADFLGQGGAPRLVKIGTSVSAMVTETAPIHLSITFRAVEPPREAMVLMPVAPDAKFSTAMVPVSVVLMATRAADTETFLLSLQQQGASKDIELLVRLPRGGDAAQVRAVLDRLCAGGYRILPDIPREAADLDGAVDAARNDFVLLADDRVILYDPRTLATLCRLLTDDPQAASASCVLLGETVFKKNTVLQVSSGGIFPGQVSFATSPGLGFIEPDSLQALPNATYPVVANSLALVLLRKAAITATRTRRLGQPDHRVTADIRFGLDAFATGYRNLCTSRVRAGITGTHAQRDEIDPLGMAYLRPARWDDLLASVTVLRELF